MVFAVASVDTTSPLVDIALAAGALAVLGALAWSFLAAAGVVAAGLLAVCLSAAGAFAAVCALAAAAVATATASARTIFFTEPSLKKTTESYGAHRHCNGTAAHDFLKRDEICFRMNDLQTMHDGSVALPSRTNATPGRFRNGSTECDPVLQGSARFLGSTRFNDEHDLPNVLARLETTMRVGGLGERIHAVDDGRDAP